MYARGNTCIGFDGDGSYDGAARGGDRLAWCFAGPLIVATSLGLWAAIGEGLLVLIG